MADVALFYGERSGGVRTYLDAKVRWAARAAGIEHHVIVPGRRERHVGTRHEVRSLRIATSNGYRVPLGTSALKSTLRHVRPDVVLLHDPFWDPLGVARVGREMGALVVAVHHASSALNAAGIPGPSQLYRPLLQNWFQHAYEGVDVVMSAADPYPDSPRPADLPLRFGLDPAFRPRPGARRGDHVLYVGRLAREKGIFQLLDAAAASAEPWPLRVVGTGPSGNALEARVERLGLERRVSFHPFVSDRPALARTYAAASCVVMPGEHETFGLVALEAAASGARVVTCSTAPSAEPAGPLAETFAPGDVQGLGRAIARARAGPPDVAHAQSLAERFTWAEAFDHELRDLRRLRG